ncbi:MAG: type IX secretion system membrane protein PorP/SprF [Bacteroidetes bacterium]|nr:type IX secretion system membrane protein PorP/SprF [Bacteroidota bacterium]
MRLFLCAFLLLFVLAAAAQQDPQLSLYMFNKQVFNPATAGSSEQLSVTLGARSQLIGFDGNPITQTLSASAPFGSFAFGIQVVNDELGAENSLNAMATIAYRMDMNFGTLSIGVSGGYLQKGLDGMEFRAPDGTYIDGKIDHGDPNIPLTYVATGMPDFAAGIYLQDDQYFGGISVTHITAPTIDYAPAYSTKIQYLRTYYLTGGYSMSLGRVAVFKPSLLVKTDFKETPQVDLNANFMFDQSLVAGVSLRGFTPNNADAIVAIVGVNLSSKWFLAYAYDVTISNLGNYSAGSHEMILKYGMDLIVTHVPPKIIYCPRFL